MSRRKLSPQEKELFVKMLEYSTGRDRWVVFWWGIFNRKRQWVLMDWLTAGMSWRGALVMARMKQPPLPIGRCQGNKGLCGKPATHKYSDLNVCKGHFNMYNDEFDELYR